MLMLLSKYLCIAVRFSKTHLCWDAPSLSLLSNLSNAVSPMIYSCGGSLSLNMLRTFPHVLELLSLILENDDIISSIPVNLLSS